MATAKKTTSDFEENADVQVAPDDWEWETAAEGAPTGVVFETIGDTFVGQYLRTQHVDREPAADGSDQSFSLYLFKGRDGELYSLNQSYSLKEAFEDGIISENTWCRITYIKDVKVANWPTPMKSFRIDVRK
jgi:hypothetical protein